MRWVFSLLAIVIVGSLAVAGAALVLPAYNIPAQYRLGLAGNETSGFVVRVVGSATNDFPVAQNGEVTIDVPRLPRACSWMWFGIILRDGSPESRKAIHVLRDGRVIRWLSLRQLDCMPLDSAGTWQIRL